MLYYLHMNKINTRTVYRVVLALIIWIFAVPTVYAMTVTVQSGVEFNPTIYSTPTPPPTYVPNTYYPNQALSITSLSPQSVVYSTNGATITIYGTNFNQNSIARWNGVARPTNFINSNTLTILISATDMRSTNGHAITVINPNGEISNTAYLAITGVPATVVSVRPGNTTVTTSTAPAVTTSDNDNPDLSGLAANAILGSPNSFWPTGLIQWLLIAILILMAMILWRKIYTSEKPNHAPLKHA
jgi:hypothetical protein